MNKSRCTVFQGGQKSKIRMAIFQFSRLDSLTKRLRGYMHGFKPETSDIEPQDARGIGRLDTAQRCLALGITP